MRTDRDELRAHFLRRLLAGGAAAWAAGFVVVLASRGGLGFWGTALAVLALELAACAVLLRLRRVHDAAMLYVVITSHPAGWAVTVYGAQGPAPSLFVLGIVVCGLLAGRRFLAFWIALAGALTVLAAQWHANRPDAGGAIPWTALAWWLAAYVLAGGLTGLFARAVERLHGLARGQARTLTRALDAAPGGAPGADLLRATLAAVAEEYRADTVRLWRLAPDARELVLALERRRAGSPAGAAPPRRSVPLAEVPAWQGLEEGAARRMEKGAALLAPGSRGGLLARLDSETGAGGCLTIEFAAERRARDDEVELAVPLARLVALEARLVELGEREREAAVAQDRARIARDVHDSLAQALTGVVLQLTAAEAALADDVPRARERLQRARDLARESLQEARRTVWAIRPPALEGGTLDEALFRLAREAADGTRVALECAVEGAARALPPETETALLRIGQEAVTNALRHGSPAAVRVRVRYEPEGLELEVADDGAGLARAPAAGGLGLAGVRERLEALGGRLVLQSEPGRGTSLLVRVPLAAAGSAGAPAP